MYGIASQRNKNLELFTTNTIRRKDYEDGWRDMIKRRTGPFNGVTNTIPSLVDTIFKQVLEPGSHVATKDRPMGFGLDVLVFPHPFMLQGPAEGRVESVAQDGLSVGDAIVLRARVALSDERYSYEQVSSVVKA